MSWSGKPSSGEGGIRTLDGGIHPHNALAGRRLQPLGHFSAGARRIADTSPADGRAAKRASFLVGADESGPSRAPPSATRPLLRGCAQDSRHVSGGRTRRAPRAVPSLFTPSGGGNGPGSGENEPAGSPLIPPAI